MALGYLSPRPYFSVQYFLPVTSPSLTVLSKYLVVNGTSCGEWHELWRMARVVENGMSCGKWHELWRMARVVENGMSCGLRNRKVCVLINRVWCVCQV